MASDPAKVSHAAEFVVGVGVEHVFDSHGSTEEESSDRVHDTLGLASGARGLHSTVSDPVICTSRGELT